MKYAAATYHQTRHLDESHLLPETKVCPWCRSLRSARLVLLQESPDVRLLECTQCNAVFTSRMPSAGALESYYRSYYTQAACAKSGAAVTLGNPRRMGRHIARLMRNIGAQRSVRILDFGGGDGTVAVETAVVLLGCSLVNQAEITVVDYNRTHATLPDRRITLKSALQLEDLPDEEFHLVIASAVLEHIPEAPRILAQILSRVLPGGMLYIRTPQVRSFVLLAQRLHFTWDFTFPAHVYDLGQDFWETYFAAATMPERFEVVSSRPSLVEASFRESPLRAGLAGLFKLPWHLLGRRWGFVGGWEIVVKRRHGARMSEPKNLTAL